MDALEILRWIAALTGMAAALVVSSDLGRKATGAGVVHMSTAMNCAPR